MSERLFKTEDGSALRFYWDTEKNNFQSEEKGRPIYDKILLVEIISPGMRDTSVQEMRREFAEELDLPPMDNTDRWQRFGKQARAFLDNEESPDLMGTPLTAWPAIDVAMAASLRESKIYTVDALANVSDGNLGVLGMQGRSLRDRARAFLDSASGGAALDQAVSENARLKEDVERLTNEVAALSARIEKQDAAKTTQDKRKPVTV